MQSRDHTATAEINTLQRTHGNQAVLRLLHPQSATPLGVQLSAEASRRPRSQRENLAVEWAPAESAVIQRAMPTADEFKSETSGGLAALFSASDPVLDAMYKRLDEYKALSKSYIVDARQQSQRFAVLSGLQNLIQQWLDAHKGDEKPLTTKRRVAVEKLQGEAREEYRKTGRTEEQEDREEWDEVPDAPTAAPDAITAAPQTAAPVAAAAPAKSAPRPLVSTRSVLTGRTAPKVDASLPLHERLVMPKEPTLMTVDEFRAKTDAGMFTFRTEELGSLDFRLEAYHAAVKGQNLTFLHESLWALYTITREWLVRHNRTTDEVALSQRDAVEALQFGVIAALQTPDKTSMPMDESGGRASLAREPGENELFTVAAFKEAAGGGVVESAVGAFSRILDALAAYHDLPKEAPDADALEASKVALRKLSDAASEVVGPIVRRQSRPGYLKGHLGMEVDDDNLKREAISKLLAQITWEQSRIELEKGRLATAG